MRLDEYKTTATLYTEGIALSCLTEDKDRKCHIAFFRPGDDGHGDGHQHTHKLELKITRIDSTGEHVVPSDKLNLNPGDKLVLEVDNPTYPECLHYTTGEFDRLSPDNHPNDYRWVVNMENDIHPGDHLELKVGRQPKDFLSTLLEVNHALFYTDSLTDFRVEKMSPGTSEGSIFGKIANRVAAKIACDEGPDSGVRLRNADRDNSIFLKRLPNVHYEIAFKNTRDETVALKDANGRERDSRKDNGDFPMFYGVLFAESGREFDLRKIEGKLATVQRVCNRAEFRVGDLSQLASSLAKETRA